MSSYTPLEREIEEYLWDLVEGEAYYLSRRLPDYNEEEQQAIRDACVILLTLREQGGRAGE